MTLTKCCTKCGKEYPATSEWFGIRKASKDGLCGWCKACNREYKRQWRQDPEIRERRREQQHQRWQDPEYREHEREYKRQRWQDPEYREYQREYHRQWRQYPEAKIILKAANHRRRARVRQLPDTLIAIEIRRMLDYWHGKCAVCGQTEGLWHTIACDHWIPVNDIRPDNPGTVATNIIPLCHAKEGVPTGTPCCNQSKRDKDPIDWLTEIYGTRKARAIIRRIEEYFEWVRQQNKNAA